MKKFISLFSVFIFLLLNVFAIPAYAQPKTFKQGVYTTEDLNLSPKQIHTIQNTSQTEYAFIAIFDSNQITRQFMRLDPQSKEYILTRLEPGYEIIISGNSGVTIS